MRKDKNAVVGSPICINSLKVPASMWSKAKMDKTLAAVDRDATGISLTVSIDGIQFRKPSLPSFAIDNDMLNEIARTFLAPVRTPGIGLSSKLRCIVAKLYNNGRATSKIMKQRISASCMSRPLDVASHALMPGFAASKVSNVLGAKTECLLLGFASTNRLFLRSGSPQIVSSSDSSSASSKAKVSATMCVGHFVDSLNAFDVCRTMTLND
mmetsp:Transcript_79817/g.124472  ORF Transcript_79817/g.124472 Transcript_79817/m.124472 type:complete len:211 (-) Transcript_79817:220-852(-)